MQNNRSGNLLRPIVLLLAVALAFALLACGAFGQGAAKVALGEEPATYELKFLTAYNDDTSSPDYRKETYETIELAKGSTLHLVHCDGTEEEIEISKDTTEDPYSGDYWNPPTGYTGEVYSYEKNDDDTPKFNDDGSFTLTGKPAKAVVSLVRFLEHWEVGADEGASIHEIWVAYEKTLTVDGASPITIGADGKTYEFLAPTSSDPMKFAAYELAWSDGNATLTTIEYGHVKSIVTYPNPEGVEVQAGVNTNSTYYVDGEARKITSDVELMQTAKPEEGYLTIGYELTYNEAGEAVFTTKSGTPKEYSIFYTYDTDFRSSSGYDTSGQPIVAPTPKQVTEVVKYHTGDEFELMQPPSREEYVFMGWYVSDDNGKTVKAGISKINAGTYGDIQLYALWLKVWKEVYKTDPTTGVGHLEYEKIAQSSASTLPIVAHDMTGKTILDGSITAKSNFIVDANTIAGYGYKYDLSLDQFGISKDSEASILSELIKHGVIEKNIISGNAPLLCKYHLNNKGDLSQGEQVVGGFGSITLSFLVPKDYRDYYYHVFQFSSDKKTLVGGKVSIKPNENGFVSYTMDTLSPIVLVRGDKIQEGDVVAPDDGSDEKTDDRKLDEVTIDDGPVDVEIEPVTVIGVRAGSMDLSGTVKRNLDASDPTAVAKKALNSLEEEDQLAAMSNELAETEAARIAEETRSGALVGVALGTIFLVFVGGFFISLRFRNANFKRYW